MPKFGAAKISIDHIDRRIGLRCSAVDRTLIRQESVFVLGFSANRMWLVSRFFYCLGFGDRFIRAIVVDTVYAHFSSPG